MARNQASKWIKRAALAVAGLAVAGGFVVAWMPKPVRVESAEARRGPMHVTVDEDGRTRVKDRHVISAPLAGNVARIELHPGDGVEKGMVVARLLPVEPPLLDARSQASAEARLLAAAAAEKQAQASVERASVALSYAEREAERLSSLGKMKASTQAEVDRALLEHRTRKEELASASFGARVAAHELEVARAVLQRTKSRRLETFEVTSPCAGRVLRLFQESEGVVAAGTPLIEVGDPTALEIVADVLTADAVHVVPGAKVSVERWGGERALAGHIRLIEPSAFTKVSALGVEEARVNAIIDLDDPHEEWAALGDGYRVEVRISVWRSEDALSVPDGALFKRRDQWNVFSIVDRRARLVPVSLGKTNGAAAQIVAGLSPGDRVILHPSDRVADGMRVEER